LVYHGPEEFFECAVLDAGMFEFAGEAGLFLYLQKDAAVLFLFRPPVSQMQNHNDDNQHDESADY
jgi:hypothetical protein